MSLLTNLKLPDLIAKSPEEYVQIAVGLAADWARLSELRAGLRKRLQSSPLANAHQFARSIEEAYRRTWHSLCAKKTPGAL
ncbi:MAG: hypothetical protein ABSF29_14855 [Tepidisphaeraceae bacterium]